ncbi:uncharacterized protein LOC135840455 isoform X2 [Planococcus citri]|uniref:uncharacterized protein LOC135840455 isoform X2 n=1 Tax=Planococcus citri TaxID=170843 RepID=UPI0031F7EA1C
MQANAAQESPQLNQSAQNTPSNQTPRLTTTTPISLTTSPASQPATKSKPTPLPARVYDKTEGMTIEDIILSEINANIKIEENIVNTILKYSLNYSSFRAVHFTTYDYLFEKKIIEIDLGEVGKILFDNFMINSSYADDHDSPKFSTLIQCNATGNTTIHVILPDISVSFNATITPTEPEILSSRGAVWGILRNGTLIGQMGMDENNTASNQVTFAKISNEISEFGLHIDPEYHELIYTKLPEVIAEIKHSLEKFFAAQLNLQVQLIMNVTTRCSKVQDTEDQTISEIYVIPDINNDSWNTVDLAVGPAIIENLTHFSQIDFQIWDVSFQNFQNLPCRNELSFRFITDLLHGKMKWSYNSTQHNSPSLTYSFSVGYFEIRCEMKPVLEPENIGLNLVKTSVQVNLGQVRVVTSEQNQDEEEKNFIDSILSDYLELLIKHWLHKSVTEKVLPKISYFDCLTGVPQST